MKVYPRRVMVRQEPRYGEENQAHRVQSKRKRKKRPKPLFNPLPILQSTARTGQIFGKHRCAGTGRPTKPRDDRTAWRGWRTGSKGRCSGIACSKFDLSASNAAGGIVNALSRYDDRHIPYCRRISERRGVDSCDIFGAGGRRCLLAAPAVGCYRGSRCSRLDALAHAGTAL